MWRLHPSELRADLQRYYGVSWDSVLSGAVSCEHAAALAANLPPGGRCLACEDERAGWTRGELLLLALVNGLRDERHQIDPFARPDATAMGTAELEDYLTAPREAVAGPRG